MAVTELTNTRAIDVRIANRCPACGHQSLFVGSGGWLTCSWVECKAAPGLDNALEYARGAVVRAAHLERDVEDARREALAMRQERDREIAARVTMERGLSPLTANLLCATHPATVEAAVEAIQPIPQHAAADGERFHAYAVGFTDAKRQALAALRKLIAVVS